MGLGNTGLLDTCLLPGLTNSSEHHYWPVMHISNTSVRVQNHITLFNRTAACKTVGTGKRSLKNHFSNQILLPKYKIRKNKKSVSIINHHQFAYLSSFIIPSMYQNFWDEQWKSCPATHATVCIHHHTILFSVYDCTMKQFLLQ